MFRLIGTPFLATACRPRVAIVNIRKMSLLPFLLVAAVPVLAQDDAAIEFDELTAWFGMSGLDTAMALSDRLP